MGKKDPRVDAYIGKAAPFARPILKHLRKVVHAGCPKVEETIKWGMPSFEYKGILCGMAAFKQHAVFGFWKEKVLAKRLPLDVRTEKDGMGTYGCLKSVGDLPPATHLERLVVEAAKINDAGIKATPGRRRTPRPALPVPASFLAAIRKNRKALAAFEAFSPSHRREYVEWVTEAKREETRAQRIATSVAWMAEGKPRMWKYQRK
jgi:uncharacterized protein YdeI (YjbR/CyaY-like superfamily)